MKSMPRSESSGENKNGEDGAGVALVAFVEVAFFCKIRWFLWFCWGFEMFFELSWSSCCSSSGGFLADLVALRL